MKLLASVVALLLGAACTGQTIVKGADGGGSDSGGESDGSGSSSGGSSGGSGSSSGSGFGCPGGFATIPSPVDPTDCVAQLASTTSCMGTPCSWMVEVPCSGEPADAGEMGTQPCIDLCSSASPEGAPAAGFCTVQPVDGGAVLVQCGGCGI